jgi:type I restriction enzyme M protein
LYWSDCYNENSNLIVANLTAYIARLEVDTDFKEFKNLIEFVRISIIGESGKEPLINGKDVKLIYEIVDSMKPLHNSGFDLFGAVYEEFANSNEKREFGEFFTRRHYTHVFSKILLRGEKYFNIDQKFTVLDLACGTGGFLTEGYKVLRNNYTKSNTFGNDAKTFLEKECFYGIDSREENISRTKLNMFLVGDGHTNIMDSNTLTRDFNKHKYDYILTNPPYGDGTIKAETDSVSSKRLEVAFLIKIIKVLKIGGKACVIVPDGVLESPSLKELRNRLLDNIDITAIVSLPKFAFAPYTKEKTYALFFTKRSDQVTKKQKNGIWFYIIDNDGLANSDKRFPTKLRNNRNGWKHDEISGWVSTDGEEKMGLLEERWLKFDDKVTNGTEWINEKNEKMNLRKGGFIEIEKIIKDKYITLLPEYYLRKYDPTYIDYTALVEETSSIYYSVESSITIV